MMEDSPRLGEEARPNENRYDSRSGSSGHERPRDRLLLEAVDLVVRSRNVPDLFRELASRILDLTECDYLKFSQHDYSQNCMVTHYWTRNQESGQCDAFAVDECVSGWAWMRQEAVSISDVEKENRFPSCTQELRKHGVRSYTVLPVSTPERRFGALGLGKSIPEVVDSADLEFFHRVAFMVSLALENQQAHRADKEQRERLQGLVKIARDLSSTLELENLTTNILSSLRGITHYDHAALMLLEEDGKMLRRYAMDSPP